MRRRRGTYRKIWMNENDVSTWDRAVYLQVL